MNKIISIDIGGTNIKWALMDEQENILDKWKMDTNAFSLKAIGVFERVLKIIQDLVKEHGKEIIGVGISMPGIVNSKTGEVLTQVTNIPSSKEVNYKKKIEDICKLSVSIINDANAATLGEMAKGNLKNVKNGLMITLGTGIGGGMIIDGKIYQGFNFAAGEFGRQFISDIRWENASSTRTLVNNAKFILGNDNITGEQVLNQLDENIYLRSEFNNWISNISKGIANIISVFSPEVVIIGGGISENENFNIDKINEQVFDYLGYDFEEKTIIKKAMNGNDAALYGAAKFFKEEIKNEKDN